MGKSFSTVTHSKQFQSMLDALLNYKNKHGNCNVPRRYKGDDANVADRNLGRWAYQQRRAFHEKTLNEKRREALENLGFDFNFGIENGEVTLETRLEVLAEFRLERKTKGIPAKQDKNPAYASLAQWIQRMRRSYRGGELPLWIKHAFIVAGIELEQPKENVVRMNPSTSAAFTRNLTTLTGWLTQHEKAHGDRNLAYKAIKEDLVAKVCYHFIEHQVLKVRQGVLSDDDWSQLVKLSFTVNNKAIKDVLNPDRTLRPIAEFNDDDVANIPMGAGHKVKPSPSAPLSQ